MSLKAMYNRNATPVGNADQFGAVSQSQQIAIEQIKQAHLGMKPGYKVLDLCVGNGSFLEKMHRKLPNASFTGIDISANMLQQANQALTLTTIEGNAAEASRYLPHHSQDLVLAHFINANIPLNTLFNEANLLTRANGHFSLITTTYESYPTAQKHLTDFINQGTFLSTIVGHYYKTMVKSATIASDYDALMQTFNAYQFDILSHQRIEIPIQFNNVEELALFGIDGTWFLSTLSLRMMPKNFLIERLKRLFSEMFTFPYQDTHIIDVVLAKK